MIATFFADGKFIYKFINIRPIFKSLVIDNLNMLRKKYSSGFFWCFGCKLAMHTQTIIYCQKNSIKIASDGSSNESTEMVEQSPFSLYLIEKFYDKLLTDMTLSTFFESKEQVDMLIIKQKEFFLMVD